MSKADKQFSMPLEPKYFWLSWGVLFFILAVFGGLAVLFAMLKALPPSVFYVHTIIGVMVVAVFPFAYLAAPRGVALSGDDLVIQKTIGPVRVPLQDVTEADVQELTGVIRTMGVGGFYGAWGQMKSEEIPKFEGYLTRSTQFVVLQRKGAPPLVLTPERPDEFVKELQARIHTEA